MPGKPKFGSITQTLAFRNKKAGKKSKKRRKKKVFKTRKKYKKTKKNGGSSYEKHLKILDKSQEDAKKTAQDAYDKALEEATQIVNDPKHASVFRPP